ncbi:VWA domain-containing protein [Kineosporia sp. R_H_3]|uniref:vWA domain-containing protein n=1 Tax=Kineosporia sp. R_H_3 TaxID=1961848 RepID=UPI000B4AF225|nr:VWA domain-containing protein [Kineosporia sp. R_H_3]
MGFAWPFVLPALLVVPLLVAGYVWAVRRRKRVAVVHPHVALVRAAAPRRAGWKRHAPFGLLLAALACLLAAGARPQVSAQVPVSASSVILALDVSGSMCATDVDPNRLTAAQAAVREFVDNQDDRTRIGLVVFSGSAQLAVPPTTERDQLVATIDGLTTGRGTTIGAAILKSVDAIAAIDPDVAPSDVELPAAGTGGTGGPGGRYAPEIVVLLTDGANTRGVPPEEAAQVAAARGVRVYPIGFGTTDPTSLVCSAAQLGGSGFDNFGPGLGGGGGAANDPRRRGFLVVDEPTLREVAETTGGRYFAATGAEQLQDVLADLPRQVEVVERDIEVTVVLAGLAGLFVLLGVGAAARWTTFPG